MKKSINAYAAFRSRNYRFYLSAQVLSIIGVQMQTLAVGWELYERTNSAAALGLAGLAQFIPVLLLSLPFGHAADTYSRKHLVMLSQLLLLCSSLGLMILSALRGPVPLFYLCLAVAGAGSALGMTSRMSFLPQLVSREDLQSAVTWNSTARQVARMAGPALGGLLIALTGAATWTYAGDVVLSTIVIGLQSFIRTPTGIRSSGRFSLQSILHGIRFVHRSKLILASITLDLFAVLLGGAVTLLPIFARDILHVGPIGLGWLQAAPSVGAFCAAIGIAHAPALRRAGPLILWSVAGFGAATIVFGLSRSMPLSLLALFLTGAFDTVSVVVRVTLQQILTPDAMRGRVSAVNAIFVSSSNELGGFESGMTAALLGPVGSVVLGGIGTMAVVLWVAQQWPDIRRLGSLKEIQSVQDI